MPRSGKKNGIPDRWLDYTAVGRRLPRTRFIAFKVPLKQSLNHKLPCSDVFGPWELLDSLKKENQELGLIIDLTFTTRYYKLQDLPESLLYVKIFTAGHEVPSDETILSFKRVVHRFLRNNADNDKLIGVHCTHGLNRTGYLICRYLIDVDGMDPKQAVELFNSSRGHTIERQNYLQDLHCGPKRSNKGIDECARVPERGTAVHRPCYSSLASDSRKESRPHLSEPRLRRAVPPQRLNPCSHLRPPREAFLPPPPFYSPMRVPLPLHPYRWTPPHCDSQWGRGAPYPGEGGSRYSSPDSQWSRDPRLQMDRRRGPLPPALPQYSPRWAYSSSSCDGPEERWAGPRMKHHYNAQ
uniref:RNA/RNP complex-1-interacting phosphatase n=1 Tax=Monopterus albus TaxID=43700 RepID=A0A3Q3I9Z4_MONAL|nr:RNA/RNP complex-1-interacting phosphatase isoform X1 [Monopterus albus]XP_020441170.1 RNA/RNP complex-1-interacting phosphatase isoform X1 [Monopterus albus]